MNIYLDEKFGFGLDLQNFLKLGLKVEQELTEAEIEEIVKKSEFQKTLDKLLKFAMLRPRSEKEIIDWFYRKKTPEVVQQDLFNRLKSLDLINDKKFAEWWIGQRMQFKSKSKRELVYELKNKGIKREVVDEVIDSAEIDEERIARDLLEKKMYKWQGLPSFERNRKISEFLGRRGFGWDVIADLKKTPGFQPEEELSSDMSSSIKRGNRGLKSAEDAIKKTTKIDD